jgi:hypothetical protein
LNQSDRMAVGELGEVAGSQGRRMSVRVRNTWMKRFPGKAMFRSLEEEVSEESDR